MLQLQQEETIDQYDCYISIVVSFHIIFSEVKETGCVCGCDCSSFHQDYL